MRALSLLLCLTLISISPSAAQNKGRTGLWFGGDFGYGRFTLTCADCPQEGSAGATIFALRGGLQLSPRVRVGIELDAGNRQNSGDAVETLTLASYWYPFRNAFLKAGVGHASFGTHTPNGPNDTGGGLGLMTGVGYEMRATEKLSLVPTLTMTYGNIGQVGTETFFGRSDVKVIVTTISFGVTYH